MRASIAILLLAVLVLVAGPDAQATQAHRIAVLELTGNLPPDQLSRLSDLVRAGALQAAPSPDYIVMSRENMAVMAQDMGLDLSCVEGSCEVETGRNLNAKYVVSGALVDMGDEWVCGVKIHNTESGALLQTDEVNGTNASQIADRLKPMVTQLMSAALAHTTAHAKATPNTSFVPPAQLDVAGKLREQACTKEAVNKGKRARDTRIREAEDSAQAAARMNWQKVVTETDRCVDLPLPERSPCIQAVEQWMTSAQAMTVTLAADVETVQTECGIRQPAFPKRTQRVHAHDLDAAKQRLRRLKGGTEAHTLMSTKELDQHLERDYRSSPGFVHALPGCETGSDHWQFIGSCKDGNFVGIYDLGYLLWARVESNHISFAQISGASLVEGEFYGIIQFGYYARASRFYGVVQLGGYNRVDHKLIGSQVGLINIAGNVRGIQIGLYNKAEHLRGLQVGLINRATENGLPFMLGLNAGF